MRSMVEGAKAERDGWGLPPPRPAAVPFPRREATGED
jgi:hypothetical protein